MLLFCCWVFSSVFLGTVCDACKITAPAPSPSAGYFRSHKSQLEGGHQHLSAFTSDFAGDHAEISRMEQVVAAGIQEAITKPPMLSAGGPSSVTLLGKRPSLSLSVTESCWVKVICDQPSGDHSIFVSVYRDGGELWMQESSGYAKQTLEGWPR